MNEILSPVIEHKHEAEAAEPQLQRPPMYRVILLNDDYTPMDFVVQILVDLFQHPVETATRLMLQVHEKGSAVCGIYPYQIAESKVARVESTSRKEGYPLRCMLERDEQN
ncbi:MAG TPA: ATP-dependent Clp protease adapter ClpS [Mariprofundaceae bacterium]|nr:ATP-dependent Clp protease adapter ClpS [Mariprofundaceae bacterium]